MDEQHAALGQAWRDIYTAFAYYDDSRKWGSPALLREEMWGLAAAVEGAKAFVADYREKAIVRQQQAAEWQRMQAAGGALGAELPEALLQPEEEGGDYEVRRFWLGHAAHAGPAELQLMLGAPRALAAQAGSSTI